MRKKPKARRNRPRDLVDFEFDTVSGQNKQLVDERNGHSIWEQLRVHSHNNKTRKMKMKI